MNFWPFKRKSVENLQKGEYDSLVWSTNTLAIVALMPLVKQFSKYEPILESNLINVWDCLMTVAMTGVAANARGVLGDSRVHAEIKKSLCNKWSFGGDLFDDCYEYVVQRTSQVNAPWSAVAAMWVADNLRLHNNANAALRNNAQDISFVNPLSMFMNLSFGETEVGLDHYLKTMAPEMDKGKDAKEKMDILALIFEMFAHQMADFIVERINK